MTKTEIKVLPDNLINKIAAGEVIDRPASVVKELMENSIDAGAKQIEVVVKNGGKNLIKVIDDGDGMNEQNAILSLQRHATSKIKTFNDIETIHTLGFRGEALASIAAVSHVELNSVPNGEIEGPSILINGGVVQKVDRTGGNQGTSIAVKNIFFNTPARRKFLRADSTEYRQILSILNRFTLAYPEIGFSLLNDDRQVFNYYSTSLEERIGHVLGNRIRDNMIAINDENAIATITGFVGNFEVMRKSRTDQYLFLNRRYIFDRTINYAVLSAFGEMIPKGAFPIFILFLKIDPARVDVNVHPTKTEVKFADQNMLYTIVRGAIKRALTTDQVIPSVQQKETQELENTQGQRFESSLLDDMRNFSMQNTRGSFKKYRDEQVSLPLSTEEEKTSSAFPLVMPSTEHASADSTAMVWQLHNKYILSQIKSGLVVIDQHVAHERILYEKAKKSFRTQASSSQQLLFPQTVDLSVEDFDYLIEILPFLEKIGFIIKNFGGKTVVVEGIPSGMRIGNENKIILDILDEYKQSLTTDVDIQERVAKSFACRSAIMSGEKLSHDSMTSLIDQLFTTENPYFCPHGRPVIVTITIDELDKRFDRK